MTFELNSENCEKLIEDASFFKEYLKNTYTMKLEQKIYTDMELLKERGCFPSNAHLMYTNIRLLEAFVKVMDQKEDWQSKSVVSWAKMSIKQMRWCFFDTMNYLNEISGKNATFAGYCWDNFEHLCRLGEMFKDYGYDVTHNLMWTCAWSRKTAGLLDHDTCRESMVKFVNLLFEKSPEKGEILVGQYSNRNLLSYPTFMGLETFEEYRKIMNQAVYDLTTTNDYEGPPPPSSATRMGQNGEYYTRVKEAEAVRALARSGQSYESLKQSAREANTIAGYVYEQ